MSVAHVHLVESKLFQLFRTMNADIRAEVKAPGYQTHYWVRFKNTKHEVEGTDLDLVYQQAKDYRNAYFNLTGEEP